MPPPKALATTALAFENNLAIIFLFLKVLRDLRILGLPIPIKISVKALHSHNPASLGNYKLQITNPKL